MFHRLIFVLTACMACGPSNLSDSRDPDVRVRAETSRSGTTSHSLGGGGAASIRYWVEWRADGRWRGGEIAVPGTAGELSGGELSAMSSAADGERVALRRAGGSWMVIYTLREEPRLVRKWTMQESEEFDWSGEPTLRELAQDLAAGEDALGPRARSEDIAAILRAAGIEPSD